MKLIVTLAVIIFFGCCCTKKMCGSGSPEVELYGYSYEEVDTILIITGNSDTTQAWANRRDDAYTFFEDAMRSDSGYTFYIPATEQLFKLHGYSYKRRECNECHPPFVKDYYMNYEGCFVNDEFYAGHTIKLYK